MVDGVVRAIEVTGNKVWVGGSVSPVLDCQWSPILHRDDGSRARSVTTSFDADDPVPGGCGRIAYTSVSKGQADVFTMTKKGTQMTRLTNGNAADRDPAWSPDCSRIAYSSTRTGDAEIFVMDADGSDRVRLTNADGAIARRPGPPTVLGSRSRATGEARRTSGR